MKKISLLIAMTLLMTVSIARAEGDPGLQQGPDGATPVVPGIACELCSIETSHEAIDQTIEKAKREEDKYCTLLPDGCPINSGTTGSEAQGAQ